MRRLPLLPTIVVLLAVATMIGLGLWQLRRAEWKEGLLAQYRAARTAPAIMGLPAGAEPASLAFRRTQLDCAITGKPIQIGGPGPAGDSGFRTIVRCRLGDGRLMMADIGWQPIGRSLPPLATGSAVRGMGVLIPDEVLAHRFAGTTGEPLPWLIVLEAPLPGYAPSTPPSVETIPNNHRGYAVQWFLFAAVALAIYALAARKRWLGR